jgi:hypothetical protein
MAGHVHPVAQGIGAEQRGARIVAEDIDQRAGVDRIDMLGIERQPVAGQPVGNPAMDARSRRIAVNRPSAPPPAASISRA